MKAQVLFVLLLLAVILIPVRFAYGDWSVWDSTKESSYQVDGKIKSISFNEQDRAILVKVESLTEPGEVETVKVCSFDQSSDIKSVEQSEKMALLRQAFSRGDRIQMSYNSPFDRCLSSINYKAAVEKAQANGKSI